MWEWKGAGHSGWRQLIEWGAGGDLGTLRVTSNLPDWGLKWLFMTLLRLTGDPNWKIGLEFEATACSVAVFFFFFFLIWRASWDVSWYNRNVVCLWHDNIYQWGGFNWKKTSKRTNSSSHLLTTSNVPIAGQALCTYQFNLPSYPPRTLVLILQTLCGATPSVSHSLKTAWHGQISVLMCISDP